LSPADRKQQNHVSPIGGEQPALDLAKRMEWPGGILGVTGIVLIAVAVGGQEFGGRLRSVQFVATLAVGALLALAGLLVIAYTNNATSRRALEVEVAGKQALMAQAEAKAEEDRRKRVEDELQLEKLRREKPASALGGG
jgi:hypothetical protein